MVCPGGVETCERLERTDGSEQYNWKQENGVLTSDLVQQVDGTTKYNWKRDRDGLITFDREEKPESQDPNPGPTKKAKT